MMRRVLVLVCLMSFGGGCALSSRDATRALADADAHAAHGDYPAAMAAYDAYLKRYPEGDGADRARVVRALVSEMMAARSERDRLVAREVDMTREATETAREATETAREATETARQAAAREGELTRQAVAREAELARLRQELAARQAEVARLREDLEVLKRTDLHMERRRR